MTLQSAIDAELPNLRREAEARMLSRCTVHRKTGDTTTDADGWEVPEWAAVYTNLRLRLGGTPQGGAGFRRVTVGDVEVDLAVRVASLPASTDDLIDGDLIEVTSGENSGVVLRIVEASWQDQATARRVPVVETQRPSEWP